MVPIVSAEEADRTATTGQNETAQGSALGNPSQTFFEPRRGEIRLWTHPPGTVDENFGVAFFRLPPKASCNVHVLREWRATDIFPGP